MAGYRNLGRLYRGIICPDLRQYVMLGDGSTMTDNRSYNADLEPNQIQGSESGVPDDRWVFTEENPARAIRVAGGLAAVARVLKGYNNPLADECLQAAESLWQQYKDMDTRASGKIETLAELILSTDKAVYKDQIVDFSGEIEKQISTVGWAVGRIRPLMDEQFNRAVAAAVRSYDQELQKAIKETPFGVPYRPNIWGAGWGIQSIGVRHYFMHKAWHDIISAEHFLNAMNFILGCHPGANNASFASGVGSKSVIVAYGVNRGDWSYIPGGVASGTALIRPDFPELKEWPFFWQQTEYVIGGGASNFMLLALAAGDLYEVD
jgi:hypothetical protein